MEIPVHIRENVWKDIEEVEEVEKEGREKDPKKTSLNGLWIFIILSLLSIIALLIQKDTSIQDAFTSLRNAEGKITSACDSLGTYSKDIQKARDSLLKKKINFASSLEGTHCVQMLPDVLTGSTLSWITQ